MQNKQDRTPDAAMRHDPLLRARMVEVIDQIGELLHDAADILATEMDASGDAFVIDALRDDLAWQLAEFLLQTALDRADVLPGHQVTRRHALSHFAPDDEPGEVEAVAPSIAGQGVVIASTFEQKIVPLFSDNPESTAELDAHLAEGWTPSASTSTPVEFEGDDAPSSVTLVTVVTLRRPVVVTA